MDKIQKTICELVQKSGTSNPVKYVNDAVKGLAIDKVNRLISKCDSCECCCNAKGMVDGRPDAWILIVGSGVPFNSDEYRSPKDSPDGKYLLEQIRKIGVDEEQLIWINAVNCFTGKNDKKRPPKINEIDECGVYLDYIIDAIKPFYILALGNTAMNTLDLGNARNHGEWQRVRDNIESMGVYSPSTAFLNLDDEDMKSDLEKEFIKDIKIFFESANETYPDTKLINK